MNKTNKEFQYYTQECKKYMVLNKTVTNHKNKDVTGSLDEKTLRKNQVKKTIISNRGLESEPIVSVIRHPETTTFHQAKKVILPCNCIVKPPLNSTGKLLQTIHSVRNRRIDVEKNLKEKLKEDEALRKALDKEVTRLVNIPKHKNQYEQLISIDYELDNLHS